MWTFIVRNAKSSGCKTSAIYSTYQLTSATPNWFETFLYKVTGKPVGSIEFISMGK